jgi:NADPH:quinone reductase-like Zn-dependent oxidoreductase
LIHAAADGVGHIAVQIAKYFGAHVIGTSSSKNKDFISKHPSIYHDFFYFYSPN